MYRLKLGTRMAILFPVFAFLFAAGAIISAFVGFGMFLLVVVLFSHPTATGPEMPQEAPTPARVKKAALLVGIASGIACASCLAWLTLPLR